MYRRSTPGQLSFENFYLPFGGKLSGENRWVKLAALIPWEKFEAEYAEQLSEDMGAPAKSFRMALGALIIKERLGTSDAETVEQIRENPYLQFFLGLSEYSDSAPFDSSMFVHFCKRLTLELVGRINEALVLPCQEQSKSETPPNEDDSKQDEDEDDEPPPNQGQLNLDASCAPGDIRYPTDLSLLNEAREATEAIIDLLYEQVRTAMPNKPRTYRQEARQAYLSVTKQRKARGKTMRKAIRKQVRADAAVRNQIEVKFGQGKRRFSLGRVMAKLAPTAECTIAITFLVMNLERWLQHLLFCFFAPLSVWMRYLEQTRQKLQPHRWQFTLALVGQ